MNNYYNVDISQSPFSGTPPFKYYEIENEVKRKFMALPQVPNKTN